MFKWYVTENFSIKVLEITVLIYRFLLFISFKGNYGSYVRVFTVYQFQRELWNLVVYQHVNYRISAV